MNGKTLGELIVEYLNVFPGATDSELSVYFGRSHQTINITCRNLVHRGLLFRRRNPDKNGFIGNYLQSESLQQRKTAQPHEKSVKMDLCAPLQEEEIKHILTDHLESEGWCVQTAWGHTRGVDIDARRDYERWMIEVKGPGASSQARVNYFLGILGETLRRMDSAEAHYSIALPNLKQYRNLWRSMPELAKERTGIDLLLVDSDGSIEVLK